jgi:hydrogenase maturation protease
MVQPVVMGLGNPDRGDDGVAFHVVNRLRRRLGSPAPRRRRHRAGRTGTEAAVLFVRQLVPELVLDVGGCSRLIFVDAHVPAEPRRSCAPASGRKRGFRPRGSRHALPPEGFLWLLQAFAGRAPESFLVSVRGEHFDFTRRLSPAAAALVDPAAGIILSLIRPHDDHRLCTDHPREV